MAGPHRRGEVLGVDDVVFLGYPDGRLQVSLELRRDISRVIREVRPQVVICQSPERNLDRIFASHPDHLAAANLKRHILHHGARAVALTQALGFKQAAFFTPRRWLNRCRRSQRTVIHAGSLSAA